MASSFRVIYYAFTGRAECLRLAAAVGDIAFEDAFITQAQQGKEKQEGKRRWSGPPEIVIFDKDGKEITTIGQSNACLRYIGGLAGIYPEDAAAKALVDEILDSTEDLFGACLGAVFRAKDADDKKAKCAEVCKEGGPLRYWLDKFILRLSENEKRGNKNGFFFGDTITIADLKFMGVSTYIDGMVIGADSKSGVLSEEKYKPILKLFDAVNANDKIKAFKAKFTENMNAFRKDNKVAIFKYDGKSIYGESAPKEEPVVDDKKVKEEEEEDVIVVNEKLATTTVKFNDGNVIPVVGLGTFLKSRAIKEYRNKDEKLSAEQIEKDKQEDEKEEREFRNAVIVAIKAGYRHIDTAQIYRTEFVIGEALQTLIAENVIKREEVFITTKVKRTIRKPQAIRDSIEKSLTDLQTDYIDLFLIHSPHTENEEGKRGHDIIEMYKILHEYKSKGKIKSVGVSNFGVKHLEILEKSCPDLPLPVCNQIECTPFLQETEIIDYCARKQILIESYSPISQAKAEVRNNAVLTELAAKYKTTWSGIMLRWQIQRGFILLPKSVTPKRIISNGDLFGFEISDEDMAKLNDLKKHNIRICWNPLSEAWDDNYIEDEVEVEEETKVRVRIADRDKIAEPLQATAKTLEKGMTKDKLSKNMKKRHDSDSLHRVGILQNKGIADGLQATAAELQQEQKKDKLKKGIRNRSDSRALETKGILPPNSSDIADSLQSTMKTLEQEQKKDKLKGQLKNRSDVKELEDRGILKYIDYDDTELEEETQNIISSLSAEELKQLKDTLQNDIKEKNDTHDAEIYVYLNEIIGEEADATDYLTGNQASETAPDHEANEEDLNIAMSPNTRKMMQDIFIEHDKKDQKIKSKEMMENMANSLSNQFARHESKEELIKKVGDSNGSNNDETKDKLKDNLENRVSKEQLMKQNILTAEQMDGTIAKSLQSTVKTLEQQQKKDKLSEGLRNRADSKTLNDKGILQNKGVADSLQATAAELQQQQKKDKLKEGLSARKDKDELHEKGILQNQGVAATLQATANKLEKQQNKDKLRAALDKQSPARELEKKGIIYNANLASSLQPNAKILEFQLRKLTQFNKSSVVQTKILQKVSRQQKKTIVKLQDINKQKDEQIQLLKDISSKQNVLIHNLHKAEQDGDEEDTKMPTDEVMDNDIKRILGVLKNLNNEISNFQVTYNRFKVDEIGKIDIQELINPNSMFNHKLDRYSQIVAAFNICCNNFNSSIDDLRQYMTDKYHPNPSKYKEWKLTDIILWIESLENGRYIKYLNQLKKGFIESDILSGEELPDLNTADLSVTPFNIKTFRDKRDLIKNFKALRNDENDDDEDNKEEEKEQLTKYQPSPITTKTTNFILDSMTTSKSTRDIITAMMNNDDEIDQTPMTSKDNEIVEQMMMNGGGDGDEVKQQEQVEEDDDDNNNKANVSQQYVD